MIKATCFLTLALGALLCSLDLFLASDGTRIIWSQHVGPAEAAEEVICVFCSATILGRVDGDVITVLGNQRIEGSVAGDAIAVGGDISLGPGAQLGLSVLAIGGTVQAHPEAQLSEPVESLPYLHFPGQRSLWHIGLPMALAAHLGLVALAAVLLRPRRISCLSEILSNRPWTSFAAGIPMLGAWALMDEWPPGLWLDWLGDTILLLFAILWLLGYASFCLLLGQRAIRRVGGFGRPLLIGGVLLFALLIVPVAGSVLWAVVSTAAYGSVFVSTFSWLSRRDFSRNRVPKREAAHKNGS